MKHCISFLIVLLSILGTELHAQKIQFKLRYVDKSYVGIVNPKWYDEVQMTPNENRENLANVSGIMTGERFGSMNFTVAKNKTGTTEEWMIKTSNGWYPLTKVKFKRDKLFMSFDWGFRAPARTVDLQVIERTRKLLDQEKFWNHDDDRNCADDFGNSKWSLYCALKQAYLDATGDFNHRAAGLNVVRETISELNPDWKYKHQLMEFNNDELYEEIIELLDLSIEKMRQSVKVN